MGAREVSSANRPVLVPRCCRCALAVPSPHMLEAISNISVTDIVGNVSASDLFAARMRDDRSLCLESGIRNLGTA